MAKTIQLSGTVEKAIVDEDDFEWLNSFKWRIIQDGYAATWVRKNKKNSYPRMHRLVLKAQNGQMIDHIDGNRLNNQKANLRFADATQNNHHRTVMNKNNTSGKIGVTLQRRRGRKSLWVASIRSRGKVYKRRFSDFEKAVQHRLVLEQFHCGNFRPNIKT